MAIFILKSGNTLPYHGGILPECEVKILSCLDFCLDPPGCVGVRELLALVIAWNLDIGLQAFFDSSFGLLERLARVAFNELFNYWYFHRA